MAHCEINFDLNTNVSDIVHRQCENKTTKYSLPLHLSSNKVTIAPNPTPTPIEVWVSWGLFIFTSGTNTRHSVSLFLNPAILSSVLGGGIKLVVRISVESHRLFPETPLKIPLPPHVS